MLFLKQVRVTHPMNKLLLNLEANIQNYRFGREASFSFWQNHRGVRPLIMERPSRVSNKGMAFEAGWSFE